MTQCSRCPRTHDTAYRMCPRCRALNRKHFRTWYHRHMKRG